MTFISVTHVMSQVIMSSLVRDLISKTITAETEKAVMTMR